jgi:hypothetical protein
MLQPQQPVQIIYISGINQLQRNKSSFRGSKKCSCTVEGIKDFLKNENNTQKMKSLITMVIELFQIAMACLLSIFVPQMCKDHLCTAQENFEDLTAFNVGVIIFNFITLFIFLVVYLYEIRREWWLIANFDVDPTVADTNLKGSLAKFPDIESKWATISHVYFWMYTALYVFIMTNLIISAILVIRFYYYDYRTITVLLTNFSLVIRKVNADFFMAWKCMSDDEVYAYSAYILDPLRFNSMDLKKYGVVKKDDDNIKPQPIGFAVQQTLTTNTHYAHNVNPSNPSTIELTNVTPHSVPFVGGYDPSIAPQVSPIIVPYSHETTTASTIIPIIPYSHETTGAMAIPVVPYVGGYVPEIQVQPYNSSAPENTVGLYNLPVSHAHGSDV